MKILIIDDVFSHCQDAEKAVKAAGHEPHDFDVVYLGLVIRRVRLWHQRGEKFWVMTDLFFPPQHVRRSDAEAGAQNYANFPSGLLVLAECQKLGIPCVIVTAGHHHGPAYEPVTRALNAMEWPAMVDFANAPSHEDEAKTKDWTKGIQRLEEMTTVGAG